MKLHNIEAIIRGFSPLRFETEHHLLHCIEALYDNPSHFYLMQLSQK